MKKKKKSNSSKKGATGVGPVRVGYVWGSTNKLLFAKVAVNRQVKDDGETT